MVPWDSVKSGFYCTAICFLCPVYIALHPVVIELIDPCMYACMYVYLCIVACLLSLAVISIVLTPSLELHLSCLNSRIFLALV
jgi:hypothetical protein